MRTLYFECNMGAAGDMLTAALYELLSETQKREFLETMNHLLPYVSVQAQPAVTGGITGTHMEVLVQGQAEEAADAVQMHHHEHDHETEQEHAHHAHAHDLHGHGHSHPHTAPADIRAVLTSLDVSDSVKSHAQAVYDSIAEAEAHAHGRPVEEIHFHEVGAMDAVADVTGVCLALEMLAPDRILSSPVHLGSGEVHCAHGILPVPAPATAYLMQGIPCYTGKIRGELCTPTGAALLTHFANGFGPMPVLRTEKIGYGIGTKEFPAANCVRAFLGETEEAARDEVIEICCTIDDMTAEALSFAGERLMELGALDIAAAPVTMKKGRAGIEYTVLCRPEEEARLAKAVLRETSTNGVRIRRCSRYILTPSVREIETKYGPVRLKCAAGDGISREKPEYEDVARIARENGLPFRQVWEEILCAAEETAEDDG